MLLIRWLLLRLILLRLLNWLLLRLIFHFLLRLVALLLRHLGAPVDSLFLRLHEPAAAAAPSHETVRAEVAFDVVFRADVAAVGALEDRLETDATESAKAHALWYVKSIDCVLCVEAMLRIMRLAGRGRESCCVRIVLGRGSGSRAGAYTAIAAGVS